MSWSQNLQGGLPPRFRPHPHWGSVARLDLNESPFPPEPDELRAMQQSLVRLDLNRYPDSDATALREALAEEPGVRENP
jgi:histidinol-phosphate/aromatic aminotransferase/cobyric acid decarboxylase-like protein